MEGEGNVTLVVMVSPPPPPYVFCTEEEYYTPTSVADPGCLSRILIFTHHWSWIPDFGSRITDPKTSTKERGEKKFVVIPFLWPQISQNWKLAQFSQNYRTFYLKICHQDLKYMGLGSGSRGQKGTGSQILDPDPQHWLPQGWAGFTLTTDVTRWVGAAPFWPVP
jgi:hypothetical protein